MVILARHVFWSEDNFHTLEITKPNLSDAGSYSVTAQNLHGLVSCKCNLIIDKGSRAYASPEFSSNIEPSTLQLRKGDDLRLTGKIEAYPSVDAVWYKDGVLFGIMTWKYYYYTLIHIADFRSV